jgi:YidC/Oxa1 family membrane protein insertase
MYSFPPLAAVIEFAYGTVTALTTAFTPLLGATSAVIAIVALTVIVRTALIPLSWRQIRAERDRTRLAPKIKELQRRFRNNPERLRRELAALYAREGSSPVAGCLPMLAQAPVFLALYGLFLSVEIGGQANVLLTHTLAGVALGSRLLDVAVGPELLVFVALMALLGVVAWLTRRMTPVPETPGAGLIRALPFGTVVIAAIVPLAAGVYLLTTTTWTVTERTVMRRLAAGHEAG